MSSVTPAFGHHASVTTTDYKWDPGWGEPDNGYRVFLSAPRHTSSGSKGECSNGFEENVNGRYHNTAAGSGGYYFETSSTDTGRSLIGRGYKVFLGRNPRDDGIDDEAGENTYLSDQWGADVHIATHSNAPDNCTATATNYFLVMYSNRNGHNSGLASKIRDRYAYQDKHPGTDYKLWNESSSNPGSLYEAGNPRAPETAYIELAHHTSTVGQEYMYSGGLGYKMGWRMGWGVDVRLSYP